LFVAALLLVVFLIVLGFSHTITLSWAGSGSDADSFNITPSGDGEENRQIAVAAGQTVETDITLVRSKMKSLYMESDQDIAVKTNSSGAPDDTVNLSADVFNIWWTGSTYFPTNPFSHADVTKLYLVNSGGTDATFKLRAIVDSTP
jgi:hypothetical protein